MAIRTKIPWALLLVVAFAIGGLAVWVAASRTVQTAEAHAALIRSNPSNGEKVTRSPARVTLNFSEPLERKLTTIEVTDKDGNQVDEGDVEFDDSDPAFASVGVPDLEPGLYLVSFDNVSTVDGHPWSGLIQFIVLNPDGSVPEGAEFDADAEVNAGGETGLLPQNIDAVTKWIALLSVAIVAGSAFWVLAVARPAASFLDEEPRERARASAEHWFTVAAHILTVTAFMSMALLILMTLSRFEVSTTLPDYFTDIQSGRYRALFLLAVVLALVGADFVYLSQRPFLRTLGLGFALGASLVALLTFSMTSHGGVGAGSFWAITGDFIHLVASSVWLGMLVMLLPLLRNLRRDENEEEALLYAANVFDRFSLAASLSVIAIFATGIFNGLVQMPSWDAFVDTTYGRVLLVKLALIVPLLAVAGINAFVFKPLLVRAIDSLHQKGGWDINAREREGSAAVISSLRSRLPWTVAAELVLVLVVFASVAVLSQTSTAKGELAARDAEAQAAGGFRDTKPAGDLTLDFEIKPNRVGLNEFNLVIRDANGAPLERAELVRLRFFYTDPTNPDASGGQTELLLNNFGQGRFTGGGAYLSQPGSWRIEAGIRRANVDDVSRNFVVSVLPAASDSQDGGGRFAMPFTTLEWVDVVGGLLIVLGLMGILYAPQLSTVLIADKRWPATAGFAVLLVGGVLAFGVSTGGGGNDLAAENPVEATEESIAAGRMLFQQNCRVCHGDTGRGDGPQASSLDPAPTDFRLHMPLHTDPQFFAFIANGYPGSAMPAWRGTLSDDDIWNLVNFMRSEFNEAPTARGSE